ncbi:mitochondrial carrier domain-containing protein [Catenaria anguillulae PL171]|uniref:Mitochondrial carrier domain-containing protein n=1 Tax=Catenaria anguillulae PL171 TaxID=765915 RepID=A0A1Y2HJB3_9FUNG|nr:mitochondrial carrier domain-containing protein [Catenaria anguillulae PL171]
MEAMVCHPLDTIKVRLQLRGAAVAGEKRPGFIGTGVRIAQREGFFALYKGLGAVVTGIVPKMAIRFSSFNFYKSALANKETGVTSMGGTFLAGLGAGITEAVIVVTPMEVVKIRLQAQRHSLSDPLDVPKYRNPAQAAYTIVKEEGFATLWKGATNSNLATLDLGLISGAMGPLCNNPIDTIKTRVQRSPTKPGVSSMAHMKSVVSSMLANEGVSAFYKGLTPACCRLDLVKASLKDAEEQLKQKDAEY